MMNNNSKAIILDMDETLEHGILLSKYGISKNLTMILRPNLDKLIYKLKEAKQYGIDIILCTTAHDCWVERFFKLKPEFKLIFDKIYTCDNEHEWKDFSKTDYPIEYSAMHQNINLEQLKPITTFSYDSLLYIDDNKIDSLRLKMLFEFGENKLHKDITHFTAFGFYGGHIDYSDMLIYKKLSNNSLEFSKLLKEYLHLERNNIGCAMMCKTIDSFINKEFKTGLTLADEDFFTEYDAFNKKIILLQKELEKFSNNLNETLEIDTISPSIDELKIFLNTDKKYPYEGILS